MIVRRFVENVNVVRRGANPARITVRRNSVVVAQRFGTVNIVKSGGVVLRRMFFADDYPDGSLVIGNIPAGKFITETIVEIAESFDDGYITVGTNEAHGILLTASESSNTQNLYLKHNFFTPETSADYKIWFDGNPTIGEGAVTIIYF